MATKEIGRDASLDATTVREIRAVWEDVTAGVFTMEQGVALTLENYFDPEQTAATIVRHARKVLALLPSDKIR